MAMLLTNLIPDLLLRDQLSALYFVQSTTYGLAFWATRRGGHAPWHVYLASCLVHFTLGLAHHWSVG
jgi:hypothetical protein